MRKGILSLIVSIGLVYAQSVIAADALPKNQKAGANKVAMQKELKDAPKHHPRHHAKHHSRQHHHAHSSGDYVDNDHYYSHHPRHQHRKVHGAKQVKKQPVAQTSQSKQAKKQANFHTQPSASELHANYQESKSYQTEKRATYSGLERSHR
jgi:hypothetical protein